MTEGYRQIQHQERERKESRRLDGISDYFCERSWNRNAGGRQVFWLKLVNGTHSALRWQTKKQKTGELDVVFNWVVGKSVRVTGGQKSPSCTDSLVSEGSIDLSLTDSLPIKHPCFSSFVRSATSPGLSLLTEGCKREGGGKQVAHELFFFFFFSVFLDPPLMM